MTIIISLKIEDKLLKKHSVTRREVEQCFENLQGGFLFDLREDHKTDPQTMWFIAATNNNRLLKVAFIQRDQDFYIRTAYEPNIDELNIYIDKASS